MILRVIRMLFVCTRMSLVFHWYVTRMCSYFIRMSLVFHLYVTRMYSYIIRVPLVCTRMSPVCDSYVLVCNPYVTRMSLVCHPYVTRLWFYHEPLTENVTKLSQFVYGNTAIGKRPSNGCSNFICSFLKSQAILKRKIGDEKLRNSQLLVSRQFIS